MKYLAATAFLIGNLAFTAPAMAQSGNNDLRPNIADESVRFVFVYGQDPCPKATGDEILVCGQLDEEERYRIPPVLRSNPNDPQIQPLDQRIKTLSRISASGINSCSPSGAAGFTGCNQLFVADAYEEKARGDGVSYNQIIEAERQRRLSKIDAESEEVEKRVVEFEKARAAKEARENGEEEDIDEGLPEPK
ncbi:hypothetical protein LPB140_06365 [Sphingorhabdus lutea]|uniref:DUF4124 domain-containing protein n=1 Tax=Sphingorhabdus lutea TaxID=1913578 RepID=A0A1L3JBG2_9SPHN|nr:hypothetical protein [Sphingorhabdus lutea]APG62471.1 hypothetical protein LPB140_06365 [Sphingorhabdus lutea]